MKKSTWRIAGFIVVILLLSLGIVKAAGSINIGVFLKIAGETLETDQNGNTNFMILGAGGENHEGADLTDSIIVVSVNHESKSINMLSIPRDKYVKDPLLGNFRINQVYPTAHRHYNQNRVKASEHTKTILEDLLDIQIHYWATLDFKGFIEIIDILGGIEVIVQSAIYDPYYPKDGTYLYEPFSIGAGLQTMDGETALKYARSRQTTSDFDRSRRQQDIIYAVKEQALKTRTLFNREKISEIMQSLQDNIQTNLSAREILTMGSMAEEFSRQNMSQYLMYDDPAKCGGFLYPPERRLYGGMFVLLPAGGDTFIQKYADMIFNYPQTSKENIKIHVLNGTTRSGVAGGTRSILRRFCFQVPRFGNALNQNVQTTTYYYKFNPERESRPASLDFLQKLIPGEESTDIPQEYLDLGYLTDTDIILEIGTDYTSSTNYIKDPFASIWAIQQTKSEEEAKTDNSNDED